MADLRAASTQARRLLIRYRRLLSAALAAVVVLLLVETIAPARPPSRPVVVASHDLESGAGLTADDVAVVEMPPPLVPAGSSSSPAGLLGRVLAAPMRAGEVVTDRSLVGPSMVAGYPAGDVAAPVRIRDAAVVSLLRVGDRIDVYAARSDTAAADLVVGHVAVLALPKTADSGQQGGLVVLAVSGPQAALLAEASATAPLSLTLLR